MLKSIRNAATLNSLGFTKLCLGGPSFVEKLKAIYKKYYSGQNTSDLYVTHNNPNNNNSLNVHVEITRLLKPYFDTCFEDYNFLASHFVVKRAQNGASMQLHQDWNVVDESKYYNYQVWIPLGVSYPENGGLCFLPKSHTFFKNYRSGSNGMPHIPIERKIHPFLSYIRLIPGEAAVFFSKTFHGSFQNSTETDRVAVLVNIIQQKAPPLYYHRNNTTKQLEAYDLTTESLFSNLPILEKGMRPKTFKNPRCCLDYNLGYKNEEITLDTLIDKATLLNKSEGKVQHYEHKFFHIFKNLQKEKQLNFKGFVVIDLLSEKEIVKLRYLLSEVFPNRDEFKGAYSSLSQYKGGKNREIHQTILSIIEARLETHFNNFKVPLSLFYSRKPDKKFVLDWHNDPSLILNEQLEPLYGVWCPLVDVGKEHGALKVIPGSHRWLNKLNIPYKTQSWPLDEKRHYLNQFSKSFQLKAGQAIVFDARLIHGSDPNVTNTNRDNIVFRINHKSSTYFNVVKKDSTITKIVKLYTQQSDYFFTELLKEHDGEPTTGKYVGEMTLFDKEISERWIDEKHALFNPMIP